MRLRNIILPISIAVGFCGSPSHAASVSLSVVQNLNFPAIAIPEVGTVDLAISPLNSSTSGSATILYGAVTRGEIRLSTDNTDSAVSISMDITDVSVSNSQVGLINFTGFYRGTYISAFPSQTLPLPDTTGTPFYVGATITTTPSVGEGNCTATFTIRVTVL